MRKLERTVAYEEVYHQIHHYITGGGFRPGDQIPSESEFCTRLGVGRGTVREALKALQTMGVIKAVPGKGMYVKEFSFDPIIDNLGYGLVSSTRNIEELLEVRQALQMQFVDRALENITDDHLERLKTLVETIKDKAYRGIAFPKEDRLFHQTFYEPAGNETVIKIIGVFWDLFARADDAIVQEPELVASYLRHQELLEAIQAQDCDRVKELVAKHDEPVYARLQEIKKRRNL